MLRISYHSIPYVNKLNTFLHVELDYCNLLKPLHMFGKISHGLQRCLLLMAIQSLWWLLIFLESQLILACFPQILVLVEQLNLLQQWFHRYLKSIIPDGDPMFLSRFWTTHFKLHDTKLRSSTTRHCQSDA